MGDDMAVVWIGLAAVAVLAGLLAFRRSCKVETVYPWEAALLYVNGTFVRQLPPGRHGFLALGRTLAVLRTPTWEQTFAMGAIDAVTADRFALRLQPTAIVRTTDPRKVIEGQSQHFNKLKLLVADALVEAVAKQPLDAVLAQPGALGAAALEAVAGGLAEIELVQLAVPPAQLPPETRRLTTEVERARVEGLAALERARGELAALRALANAARLATDNPELIRLRTLQALGQAGKGATLVVGQDPLPAGATASRKKPTNP